jgi:DNA-binding NtrC family response regulator
VLRQTVRQHFSDYQIIGHSGVMSDLMQKVEKIAQDAHATCLLQGESGTGKDLVARAIHSMSNRNREPFIPINCAAIPANLLESELFGHEKGSFTGAIDTQLGKFEQAKDGVIFLDEISELPMHLQVVLLRVLEEREFYRIGGKRPINVNVMILAASNQDLEQLVHETRFREDLFFRLNVIKIVIPPLRERPDDIESLSKFFLQKFNEQRNKKLKLSKAALNVLKRYEFPGNVRELRNIIEDAFVFCDGRSIKPADLRFNEQRKFQYFKGDKTGIGNDNGSLFKLKHQSALNEFEKIYFTHILKKNEWKMNETAKEVGLSREWLSKKIRSLGLKKDKGKK